MIKAIALDDEILALKVLENYCNRIENLDLVKVFYKQNDAQKYLNKYPVDIIFLDIEMPTKNGFDFLKNLSQDINVIFTTAYANYAVDAFNVNAIDYLLKPFSFERFSTAVDKIKINTQDDSKKHLTIRADYKLHKINFEDILFIEGLDDYVKIHLKDLTRITARSSMKNILEKLPEKDFIRVHRSYILPIHYIKTIVNKNIYINDFVIPIGETYKEAVKKVILPQ